MFTDRGLRVLSDNAERLVVMIGAFYGSFHVETRERHTGDEVEKLVRDLIAKPEWQEPLVDVIRHAVGNFTLIVLERAARTLAVVNSLQTQLFHVFDGDTLVLSTDQSQVFARSKGVVNEDDVMIYVLMSEEGVRSTFLNDCHRMPCGTLNVLDIPKRELLSSECLWQEHVWQRMRAGAEFASFGDVVNEIGRFYAQRLQGREVIATMSGIDAATASIALLNGGLHCDSLVSDNYPHQTAVSKSMWEDISAAFPDRAGSHHIVGYKNYNEDNGPDFANRLEVVYRDFLYMDHSNFHITEGFCSAMKPGTVTFGGQLIGTGRAGALNHTSLYKASLYKGHLFGFRDRLVYTLDYMRWTSRINPDCYQDIMDASSYPGAACDSDYLEIRNRWHEALFQPFTDAYERRVLKELHVEKTPEDVERQLYDIHYFELKQKLMQGVITTTEAWSRRYGIQGMQLLSDGPGMHVLLATYYKRWWDALLPKQVVYDYWRRMTGRSFYSTARKARRYCRPEDSRGFLPKSPLSFFKFLTLEYWKKRRAKIRRSLGKRYPALASWFGKEEPPPSRRDDGKPVLECPSFYMPVLWEKYRGLCDLRKHVQTPVFRDKLDELVRRIESGQHRQDGQIDRFLNLTVFLSKYVS